MRPTLRMVGLALFATVALAACVTAGARSECLGPRQPDELSRLVRLADSAGTAVRLSVDTMAAMPRRFLQGVVNRLDALARCGALRTPDALRDAAQSALAARTLGLPTVERAYRWARAAVVADSADRRNWRVMAEAWDQLQVLQQKPQWWATVVTCASPVLGRCSLAPLDSTRVTDALRIEFGLPTLPRQRALVDSMNRIRGHP
jgi:hypothetical protein